MIRAVALLLFLSIWMASPALAEKARLQVRVTDADGALLPCRVWVDAAGQRLFEPEKPATHTVYARDRSFSCDGRFEIEVPHGRVTIHAERGKEYLPIDHSVEVSADETKAVELLLRRWVNMPSEGWYSGDMHVHLGVDSAEVLRQLALADDVHFVPALTYWLRETGEWPKQWPDWGPERERDWAAGGAVVVDPHHLITQGNLEVERIQKGAEPTSTIGASLLFNLKRPITAARVDRNFPTDTTLLLRARAESPAAVIDTDTPSWAETVVGIALGLYDTVKACHNHYHREHTLPGGWGMIGTFEEGEPRVEDRDGLFHRTNDLYYRFLNCGFRLAVSGGSAVGVMPLPMGYNRVYVHIEGDLTPEKFWASLKSGNSFATSGPMLTMSVDGEPLGATIRRSAGDASLLSVKVRVRSIDRLESIDLVADGRVIRQAYLRDSDVAPIANDRHPVSEEILHWDVVAPRSGWMAARALFRAPDGWLRQAHTSPVYIAVEGSPASHRADALYMIRWIDRLLEISSRPGRFSSEADRQQVQAVYRRAKSVYEKLAARPE